MGSFDTGKGISITSTSAFGSRAWRRGALGALVLLAALGCRHRGGTTTEAGEPESAQLEQAGEEEGPSLAEIADAIDPGPRAALTPDFPAWLIEGLDLPAEPSDPEDAVAWAQAWFDAWKAQVQSGDGSTWGVVELIRALAYAEQGGGSLEQLPIESLIMLEQIYHIVGAVESFTDNKLFLELVQNFVEVIAREGDLDGSDLLDEVAELIFGAPKRAVELRLHTVAVLLRRAPAHSAIPKILSRTAESVFDDDEALGVGMAVRSVAMRGGGATAEQWLTLATLCHRSLDLRCGDRALAKAEALVKTAAADDDDEELNESLQEAALLAKAAQQAVELEDAPGLQDSLVRGEALIELYRYDEAKEVFGRLHELHPEDARPVVGLVSAVLLDGFDLVGAFEVLERVQPREHRDRSWYELSIGVRASTMLYNILPKIAEEDPDAVFEMLRPILEKLHSDIEGFEALGADKGRVLSFIYDLAMEAWPLFRSEEEGSMLGLARGLLARTLTLQAEVPSSPQAYTLVLASAEFSDDRTQALAVLDLELPSEHRETIALRRARAAVDLVATWGASDRVDTMLRLVDAVDGPKKPLEVRRMAIDARVLAQRLGYVGGDSLPELERRYQALRDTGSGAHDVVLLNNLAVLVAGQGRIDEAEELWSEAIEQAEEDDEHHMLRLNVLAARSVAGGRGSTFTSGQSAELLALAEDEDVSVKVRLLAYAWRVAGSEGARARKARKTLRAIAKREARVNFRPRNLPSEGGVILQSGVEMSLGYSRDEGMQFEIYVESVPWLMVPCPVAIPDPRRE